MDAALTAMQRRPVVVGVAAAIALAIAVGRPRALDRTRAERLAGPNPEMTAAAVPGDPPGTRAARFLTTLAQPTPTTAAEAATATTTTTTTANDDGSAPSLAPPTAPTVVLVHGFGCTGLEWADGVAPALAARGLRVFSYDRIAFAEPGTAPAGAARTAERLAAELRALLAARGVEPPFVVVGHSYGGLVAQVFAMQFPGDVNGLVLVDPAHEQQNACFPRDFALAFKLVPAIFRVYAALAWTGILGGLDRLGLFNFPPTFLFRDAERRRTAVRLYSEAAPWARAAAELAGANASFESMPDFRAAHAPLSPALTGPLALIIAADRRYSPTRNPEGVTRAFLDMHAELAAAHGIAPVQALHSDHWVHLQQPQLVVDAVVDVLARCDRLARCGGDCSEQSGD